jgi:hypothetical protein
MSEAREVMDRMTEAAVAQDVDALAALYAVDAVATTPDAGELKGREQIAEYLAQFMAALPDGRYELVAGHESGNVAIDEGYMSGTNTGILSGPAGEIPATLKPVRLRTCDIATVENGLITSHRFYYDQLEFFDQLELAPDMLG